MPIVSSASGSADRRRALRERPSLPPQHAPAAALRAAAIHSSCAYPCPFPFPPGAGPSSGRAPCLTARQAFPRCLMPAAWAPAAPAAMPWAAAPPAAPPCRPQRACQSPPLTGSRPWGAARPPEAPGMVLHGLAGRCGPWPHSGVGAATPPPPPSLPCRCLPSLLYSRSPVCSASPCVHATLLCWRSLSTPGEGGRGRRGSRLRGACCCAAGRRCRRANCARAGLRRLAPSPCCCCAAQNGPYLPEY